MALSEQKHTVPILHYCNILSKYPQKGRKCRVPGGKFAHSGPDQSCVLIAFPFFACRSCTFPYPAAVISGFIWTLLKLAERCCDMGQNDTIGKIELKIIFRLAVGISNSRNDIQLFLQLFDELRVNGDYH